GTDGSSAPLNVAPSGDREPAKYSFLSSLDTSAVLFGDSAPQRRLSRKSCLISSLVRPVRTDWLMDLQMGSMAVRTTANMKTAAAKLNATRRTRRCSNFPEALAKKSTVANKTVFARY